MNLLILSDIIKKMNSKKEKYFKFSLIIVFSYLISYLWIKDSSYSNSSSSMLLYLVYSIIFFLLPGYLLTLRLKIFNILEVIVYSMLTGIISVSTFTFLYSGITITKLTFLKIIICSVILSLIAIIINRKYLFSKFKNIKSFSIKFSELLCFLIIITIVWYVYMCSYHPGEEFLYSVDYWIDHHTTHCWVNATLEILNYTKELKSGEYTPYKTIFYFPPNVTFGNVAISSNFVELFQLAGWRFIYLIQGIFIGLFLFYIFLFFRVNIYISMISSLICCCNPFFLNILSADRNVIAVMIALFLLYIYLKTKQNHILFGFISSFLITVGLREITMLISLVFLYLYFFKRTFKFRYKLKVFALYIIGFFPAILLVSLHYKNGILYYPYISECNFFGSYKFFYKGLLNYPFTPELVRVPFSAFPPFINNILMIIRTTGYLFSIISIFGIYALYKLNKKLCISLIIIFLSYFVLLGTQGDWLLYEKNYPSSMMLFSMFISFGVGLDSIIRRFKIFKILGIIIILMFLYLSINRLKNIDFQVDGRIYKLHNIRDESISEYLNTKKNICNISLFPDYSKVWFYSYIIKHSNFIELPYNSMKKFRKNREILKTFHWLRYLNNFFINYGVIGNHKKKLKRHIIMKFNKDTNISDSISIVKNINNKDIEIIKNNKEYVFSDVYSEDLTIDKYKIERGKIIAVNNKFNENDRITDANGFIWNYDIKFNKNKLKSNGKTIKIGFKVFDKDIFGIVRTTYTMTKYWGGKFIIKNEIWLYKVKDLKINKIAYINNYTAKLSELSEL